MIDLICNHYYAEQSLKDPNFVYIPVILGGDNPQCRHDKDVQQRVATFSLVVSVMVGILSSLTVPKLGALSDRYGRKRMMVICSFGGVVGEVITIMAAKFPDTIHYQWLILGAFFDGLTGSFTAGSVLSHSYTSDCTPPSQRSVAIGRLHACLFTGLAIGPLLAGYFVEWMGSLLSIFYVTLGCHIAFILFMAFIIPESLSKKRQLLAREKHAAQKKEDLGPGMRLVADGASMFALPFHKELRDSMRSLRTANPLAPLRILFPRGQENRKVRRNLIVLALIDTAIIGAAMSAGGVTLLYTQDTFSWGNLESSRFISMVSMVRVVVLMGIFPVINYVFRTRPEARRRRESGVALAEKNAGADKVDIWILRTALVSDVVGAVGYIFVRTSGLFVASAIITGFGGLGSATLQASLSKHVPAESVGQLLGAIGLMHALSRIVCPIIFNGLYAATVKFYPQAFFVLLASVYGVSVLASWLIRPGGMLPALSSLFVFTNCGWFVVYMTEDYKPVSSLPPPEEEDIRRRDVRDRFEDEEVLPVIS